jgi:hypothetical protein
MCDPPHLLKSVRNNIRRYPVKHRGGIARWDHIKQFFELDVQKKLRLAPKLKLVHIILNEFREVNVRLAAQVLRYSFAVGIAYYVNASRSQSP